MVIFILFCSCLLALRGKFLGAVDSCDTSSIYLAAGKMKQLFMNDVCNPNITLNGVQVVYNNGIIKPVYCLRL